MLSRICLVAAILCLAQSGAAQFISSDTYTRYELLAPDSHQFKIYYEVTETRSGARFHFNPIREGSEASDESVIDLATGKPLKFEVVTGAQAQAAVASDANKDAPQFAPTSKYIQVQLAHPVPAPGECRIAIIKTYKDDKLLHGRRRDRFQATARHTSQQRGAAGRIRGRIVFSCCAGSH
ncbi:MAG TPA: hypothetical protein VNS63_00820 [Blastocatellia bacterium]|nr:hypothetical protein [Blastocatellia bacterium]